MPTFRQASTIGALITTTSFLLLALVGPVPGVTISIHGGDQADDVASDSIFLHAKKVLKRIALGFTDHSWSPAESSGFAFADHQEDGFPDEFGVDDDAEQAYKAAYRYILDEDWEAALGALAAYNDAHRGSRFDDDVDYWTCHVDEQLGANEEMVFECYERFVDDHSRSRWADDAQSNMVRLARSLNQSGKAEFGDRLRELQDDEDEEVKLAALDALWMMGDPKVLPTIRKLYNSSQSDRVRSKVLFALSQIGGEESLDLLVHIAETDPDQDVRSNAVFHVSQHESDRVADILRDFAMNEDLHVDIQKRAVMAIAQLNGAQAKDGLMHVLDNHRNPKVTGNAAFWLSQASFWRGMTDSEAAPLLRTYVELLNRSNDSEVREKVLHGLSELPDGLGVPALIELATSSENVQVRKKAVFWLGQSQDDRAREALVRIVSGN